MIYTKVMSKRRNAMGGRKAHFDEAVQTSTNNGANKNTYDFGDGTVINLSEETKKHMSSKKPGVEWHPANPKLGISVHNTSMENIEDCAKCSRLDLQGIHPSA